MSDSSGLSASSDQPGPAGPGPLPPGTIRIFGVPVRFHFTFLIIAFFTLFNSLSLESGAVRSILYLVGLFGSVLAHELGHALTARRFGIPTDEIVMYPIGGVARLGRSPAPREEIWITAAGPLVNFIIVGVIVGIVILQGPLPSLEALKQPTPISFLMRLAASNLGLGLFNLLPAFPMDGGRLLRAFLALRLAPARATAISSNIGKAIAVLMGLYAVLTGAYALVFIAVFVFLGANQENVAVQQRSLLQNVAVREAMDTGFRTLSHGNTLAEASAVLPLTAQTDFPVLSGTSVVGMLSRSALLEGLSTEGPSAYVAGVMQRGYRMLSPDSDLGQLLTGGQLTNEPALVMEGDTLVGLLTPQHLADFLRARHAARA